MAKITTSTLKANDEAAIQFPPVGGLPAEWYRANSLLDLIRGSMVIAQLQGPEWCDVASLLHDAHERGMRIQGKILAAEHIRARAKDAANG